MTYKISDNIISPLGFTTEENFQAVKDGKSALCRHTDKLDMPEPFFGSLFSEEQNQRILIDGFTRFESLIIQSVKSAIKDIDIPIESERLIFIVSTTKANIAELKTSDGTSDRLYPGIAAKKISDYLGISTQPIVVCNACISGVSAIITAKRLLDSNKYDYAIVCGAESLSKFIISGFQSLKALSSRQCQPFDIERIGLNLGEAAATIVLSSKSEYRNGNWSIENGFICNDAYHISSPSPKGDGSLMALNSVISNCDSKELAFINLHGTATLYNDQMESKAIERANLLEVPINALKGYYGHTLGAAGILETIISMHATDHNTILGTRGFSERGVSGHLNITGENRATDKKSFIKLISGFGGCNAALLASKKANENSELAEPVKTKTVHSVNITSDSVTVDGKKVETQNLGKAMLTEIYKNHIGEYSKFYKMDMLSRLGFIASELLIRAENGERFTDRNDRAVILFNRSSSIVADREYLKTITDDNEYFPSPSAFVYTLPNIVTGEIAIRNKYHGETSFYILPEHDRMLIDRIKETIFSNRQTTSMICGWIDCDSENSFEAQLELIIKI